MRNRYMIAETWGEAFYLNMLYSRCETGDLRYETTTNIYFLLSTFYFLLSTFYFLLSTNDYINFFINLPPLKRQ